MMRAAADRRHAGGSVLADRKGAPHLLPTPHPQGARTRSRTMSTARRAFPGASWIVAALALLCAGPAAAQQAELLVRGGTVVNATGQQRADVRIRNGVIAEIGPNLTAAQGVRVIDAT